MNKRLSEIDRVYDRLYKQGTLSQKLNYCTSLIYKTENYVVNNRSSLSEYLKKKSFALIIAAEEEIKKLSKTP